MEIVRERFDQIKEAHPNGHFLMVTLTVRRVPGVPLQDVLGGLRKAHQRTTSGKGWQLLKAEMGGQFHYVRGREIVLSPNIAWGPHDHWAVFVPGSQSAAEKVRTFRKVVARFIRSARAVGISASLKGQDVQISDTPEKAAEYATKGAASSRWGAVEEAAGGAMKNSAPDADFGKRLADLQADARSDRRGISIWQLLAAAHGGDLEARALVEDYAKATKGQRVVSTSRSIKLTADQDMPDPEAEAEPEPLAVLSNATMRRLGQVRAAELRSDVEDAFAAGGRDQVLGLLRERLRGQRWRWCPDPNALVSERISREDWDAIEADIEATPRACGQLVASATGSR